MIAARPCRAAPNSGPDQPLRELPGVGPEPQDAVELHLGGLPLGGLGERGQIIEDRPMALPCRAHERAGPAERLNVHVGPRLDENRHQVEPAALDGVDQRRVFPVLLDLVDGGPRPDEGGDSRGNAAAHGIPDRGDVARVVLLRLPLLRHRSRSDPRSGLGGLGIDPPPRHAARPIIRLTGGRPNRA